MLEQVALVDKLKRNFRLEMEVIKESYEQKIAQLGALVMEERGKTCEEVKRATKQQRSEIAVLTMRNESLLRTLKELGAE